MVDRTNVVQHGPRVLRVIQDTILADPGVTQLWESVITALELRNVDHPDDIDDRNIRLERLFVRLIKGCMRFQGKQMMKNFNSARTSKHHQDKSALRPFLKASAVTSANSKSPAPEASDAAGSPTYRKRIRGGEPKATTTVERLKAVTGGDIEAAVDALMDADDEEIELITSDEEQEHEEEGMDDEEGEEEHDQEQEHEEEGMDDEEEEEEHDEEDQEEEEEMDDADIDID